jgi:parallel beta-helix repeat protein
VNCPGDGVVIGASGITFDLGGHLLDGTNAGRGVDNRAGHDDLTITGGTITDFFFAVDMLRAQSGTITRLNTPETINLSDSPDALIKRNTIGFVNVQGNSDRVVIARNDITGRIFVQGGFLPDPPPCCPDIPTGSPEDVVIDRNTITSSLQGIIADSAPRAIVTRNEVTISNPGEFAIGIAVAITSTSHPTLIERNTVSGSTIGIRLARANGTVVSKNRVVENVGDGVQTTNSTNVVIDGNRADRNGDDGIDVDSAPALISHNSANFNGDLGIEAVPGVTDGGGNKAHGNGNPAQYINVSCK